MSSLRCKIGVHDWNKYGEMVPAYGGLTQFRSCKRCNKIAYSGCYGNQASHELINKTTAQIETDKLNEDKQ